MGLLNNERGAGSLLYIIMISIVLMIVTPTILYLSSNDSLNNVTINNQSIATNLAVSGMEAFNIYLNQYTTGDRIAYLNGYPGFGTKTYTTPEGTAITYSFAMTGPVANKFTIRMTATAGNGNLQRTKTVAYLLNSDFTQTPTTTTVSTDPDERYIAVPGNAFYVGGTKQGNTVVSTATTGADLSTAIGDAIQIYKAKVDADVSVATTHANKLICNSCTSPETITTAVNNAIANTTANPIVIEMSQNIDVNQSTPDLNWGSPTRPVILIFRSLTFNGGRTAHIYGDVIVKNQMTLNNTPKITISKVNNLHGNLYVLETLTSNLGEITLDETLYSNNLTIHNDSKISGGKLIVKNELQATLTANLSFSGRDVLVGTITAHNNAKINAPYGDILVQNGVTATGDVAFTSGGSVAAGGNFTAWNNFTVTTGGQTTSLIVPVTGGSGSSGGGGGSSSGGSGEGASQGWGGSRIE